jgi:serine/threonine protein kinase
VQNTTLDELLWLWEEQKEAGAPVSPEELCADCPELLEELRWHIAALEAVASKFGIATDSVAASTPGAESTSSPRPPAVVRMSSEFRVENLHATGGLGAVYRAYDPRLNRRVALKFPKQFRQSNAVRARFEREAHITSQLDHPGIVPVHAVSSTIDGPLCYATRFVEGRTLQEAIQQCHESPASMPGSELRQLLQRFVAVCNIVAYAHARKIIHRDIKPANILLGSFGETLLIDWGLAKVLGGVPDEHSSESDQLDRDIEASGSVATETGQVMGTPAYASPEQYLGRTAEVAESSDVYSLGATLFTILTGKPPSSSSGFPHQQLTAGVIKSAIEQVSSVPVSLNAICVKAMSMQAGNRYPSAMMLARDIERWLADETVSVLPDPLRVRLGRAVRKRPGAAAATVATALVALLAGILGSAVLGQKNRQLMASNDLLTEAISRSELANRQTLSALRSLVDDVVIEKFDEQASLGVSERRFLDSVLVQYQAYAGLQNDSQENREIRAEGLMQSGRIQLRLSNDVLALRDLHAASELLEELFEGTGQAEHQIKLAKALADMSEALLRCGRLEEGEVAAERGIEFCNRDQATAETVSADSRSIRAACADLHRMKGTIQTRNQKWKDAATSFSLAEQLLGHLLKLDPTNVEYQQSMSTISRALSVTWGRMGDSSRQSEYSQRTMKLQQSLADQFPDDPEYQASLVNSIYSHSALSELHGQTNKAVEELSRGIGIALALVNRYPLVARHRELLGLLLNRRGTLQTKLDEPTLAANDLRQAVTIFRGLVQDFPESSESLVRLQESLFSLASQQSRISRVKEADALFKELFRAEALMQQKFPEAASRSTIRARSQIEYATVLLRMARNSEAKRVLTESVRSLAAAVKDDQTESTRIALARAHIALASVLTTVGSTPQAQQELVRAAEIAESIAGKHPSEFELLSQVAALHGGVSDAFETLRQEEPSATHHQRELELRGMLVDAFPENPFYRVESVRTHVRHGRGFIPRGDFPSSENSLAAAETALITARRDFPNDPLIQKTQGEIDRGLGSLLFNMGRYADAMVHFDAAVKLNPDMDHQASRIRCMAEVRPDDVLAELHRIEQGTLPTGGPLKNLIFAAGVAAQNVKDPEDMVGLCDVVTRLLRYMVNEDFFPKDRTIRELQTQRRFSKLRLRPGFKEFLARLEQRNQILSSPLLSWVKQAMVPGLTRFKNARSWNDLRFLGLPGQLLHGLRFVVNSMPSYSAIVNPAESSPAPR